jgi:L-lysine 6-transaminase
MSSRRILNRSNGEALKKRQRRRDHHRTIQGEGGDNHFRPRVLQEVRKLADKYQAMFILDEVQTGMGLTGKWWAYEHMGIKPDIICFGKKSRYAASVLPSGSNEAIRTITSSSRAVGSTRLGAAISLTWSVPELTIEVMKERQPRRTRRQSRSLLPRPATNWESQTMLNVRGSGLMLAFDLPTTERRDEVVFKLHEEGLLALKCGSKGSASVRL